MGVPTDLPALSRQTREIFVAQILPTAVTS